MIERNGVGGLLLLRLSLPFLTQFEEKLSYAVCLFLRETVFYAKIQVVAQPFHIEPMGTTRNTFLQKQGCKSFVQC